MMIRSATALRNDYDGMVKLSTEKQEPIYLTRNGDGEMVFLPIEVSEHCSSANTSASTKSRWIRFISTILQMPERIICIISLAWNRRL